MSKKIALIVDVMFCTRVVVEVPDDFKPADALDDSDVLKAIAEQATPNIIAKINNDEVQENIIDAWMDEDCPYGSLPQDN